MVPAASMEMFALPRGASRGIECPPVSGRSHSESIPECTVMPCAYLRRRVRTGWFGRQLQIGVLREGIRAPLRQAQTIGIASTCKIGTVRLDLIRKLHRGR